MSTPRITPATHRYTSVASAATCRSHACCCHVVPTSTAHRKTASGSGHLQPPIPNSSVNLLNIVKQCILCYVLFQFKTYT